jgi:hypothetical protein
MPRYIKRALAAVLVALAANAASVAYARPIVDPGQPISTQQQRNVEPRSASEGARPAAVSSVRPTVTSHDGFQWSDAGIGAAGILILLSGGMVAAVAVRHRRTSSTVIG